MRMRKKNIGAGDENRTRTTSLEDWGSTIELHPRAPQEYYSIFFLTKNRTESVHTNITQLQFRRTRGYEVH